MRYRTSSLRSKRHACVHNGTFPVFFLEKKTPGSYGRANGPCRRLSQKAQSLDPRRRGRPRRRAEAFVARWKAPAYVVTVLLCTSRKPTLVSDRLNGTRPTGTGTSPGVRTRGRKRKRGGRAWVGGGGNAPRNYGMAWRG